MVERWRDSLRFMSVAWSSAYSTKRYAPRQHLHRQELWTSMTWMLLPCDICWSSSTPEPSRHKPNIICSAQNGEASIAMQLVLFAAEAPPLTSDATSPSFKSTISHTKIGPWNTKKGESARHSLVALLWVCLLKRSEVISPDILSGFIFRTHACLQSFASSICNKRTSVAAPIWSFSPHRRCRVCGGIERERERLQDKFDKTLPLKFL